MTTTTAGDVKSADCPSGATLQKLVELPKGMTFGRSSVSRTGRLPTRRARTSGDGVYLFHYMAGTGWKYYDQGSG